MAQLENHPPTIKGKIAVDVIKAFLKFLNLRKTGRIKLMLRLDFGCFGSLYVCQLISIDQMMSWTREFKH